MKFPPGFSGTPASLPRFLRVTIALRPWTPNGGGSDPTISSVHTHVHRFPSSGSPRVEVSRDGRSGEDMALDLRTFLRVLSS